ncbi:hypothetical protein EBZ35_01775 [bacterium]|nr:hypothetical protein [bacterium]
MTKKKRSLSTQQATSLLPSVESFNAMATVMIRLLNEKIDAQQRRLRTISHVINVDYTPPTTHSVSVSMLDIGHTKVRQKGKAVTHTTMSWEEDLKRQRRGYIL